MRAVDANLLVSVLQRDDAAQASAAEDFVAAGAWGAATAKHILEILKVLQILQT